MIKTTVAFKITLWTSALITSLVLFGILLIKPEIRTHNFQHINKNHSKIIQLKSKDIEIDHKNEIEIWGSMSLIEATSKYDIPINLIQEEFQISDTECKETIGRLRKKYGFTMAELKELLIENRDKK